MPPAAGDGASETTESEQSAAGSINSENCFRLHAVFEGVVSYTDFIHISVMSIPRGPAVTFLEK